MKNDACPMRRRGSDDNAAGYGVTRTIFATNNSILYPIKESDILTVVHPLLRLSRGKMMLKLDFAHSLTSVGILSYEPASSVLAIIHQKLPWPIVIQTSGDREWVTVTDVVETLWYALHIGDILQMSTSSLFLESQDDAPFDSCRSCVYATVGIYFLEQELETHIQRQWTLLEELTSLWPSLSASAKRATTIDVEISVTMTLNPREKVGLGLYAQ
ncbi:uncharacterized protein BT62DRAFT_1061697 [Guyanagaster necrorhizus]|uniref:DUF6699 domain-containing protein n=1 Tax=Guyanagaster necrorhizus TaxID=856835 RepID=A0A9P7VUZ7_9AGAR|nr:uncharacterized protein BT62DRAFT_1061697 [Guyanagaster necrorhizus MCA 3950]KAG7447853.1 hypothetical protein BT62DRAFT_1061697 [Guyanagaster necrorhizus MCA 3950]